MFTPTRFAGAAALGLGLALVAGAQQGAQREPPPAVAAILKLADNLDAKDVAARAQRIVKEFDSCDISQVFTLSKRGGAGIGSAATDGYRDSIDDLVRKWAGPRPPTEKQLKAHKTDLLRAARVLQAMAELAPYRMPLLIPKSNEKKLEQSREVVKDFRAVTRQFRDAIDKIDAVQTRKAAVSLEKTCNACHILVGI
jgi:hypothetical protein